MAFIQCTEIRVHHLNIVKKYSGRHINYISGMHERLFLVQLSLMK